MTVKISPIFNDAQLDGSGNPYTGAKLFTYTAQSSTKQTAYQDSAGITGHTNPIILNSRGEPPAPIWLTSGVAYKFVLAAPTDADPPNSPIRTVDNIAGVNDTTITLDEWIAGPSPTYVSATSFTLSGDQTTQFHKSRRLKTTNSGGTVYSTILTSVFGALTTVTVANDSGSLDAGLSAVSYSIVKADNPSISSDMVYRKGAAVTSAATTNIWGIVGDFVHITGSTGPITSFGTAPYAGARREIIFDSTPTITHNATSLILPGGANIVAAAGDRAIVRADTTANMIVVDYIKASGLPPRATQPTRQVLTSGSGATYTTPTNATRIFVRMVGGGGGGGGSGTSGASNGGNGGNTTFSTFTAGGGVLGTASSSAAAGTAGGGGTASGGSLNLAGGSGCGTDGVQGGSGGQGGASAFGGNGGGGTPPAGAGVAGATNTGGGGGGASGTGSGFFAGGAGGAGGYVEAIVAAPSATYTYTIGAAGTAGGSGVAGAAGGAGGSGIVIVDEFYD
jgi:hypothetical protein